MKVLFFGCGPRPLPPELAEHGIIVEWPDFLGRHGRDKRLVDSLEKRVRSGTFAALVLWSAQVGHSSADFLIEAANKVAVRVIRRVRPTKAGLAEVTALLMAYKKEIDALMAECPEVRDAYAEYDEK